MRNPFNKSFIENISYAGLLLKLKSEDEIWMLTDWKYNWNCKKKQVLLHRKFQEHLLQRQNGQEW